MKVLIKEKAIMSCERKLNKLLKFLESERDWILYKQQYPSDDYEPWELIGKELCLDKIIEYVKNELMTNENKLEEITDKLQEDVEYYDELLESNSLEEPEYWQLVGERRYVKKLLKYIQESDSGE